MNYLAHTNQGSTLSTEHHVLAQDMPNKFDGPSAQAQEFNNNEMYMDDESDHQSLTNNSNRTSYERFPHRSGLETMYSNSGAFLDASTRQVIARSPPSSLDMFKSSVGSYLASFESTTSESSSKSMIPTGVSSDERSGSTSRQDMNEMTTSETQAYQRPPTHKANLFAFPSDMSQEPSRTQTPQFSQSFSQHHLHQGISMTPLPSSTSPVSSTNVTKSTEDIAIRRAEQNRAAQRSFRQRKQKYVKWLESKAKELNEVYRIMALVRTENQQLCNLVMELDARLNSLDPTTSNMSPTNAMIPSGSAPILTSSLSDTCKSISPLTALKPHFGRTSDRSTPMDDRTRPNDSLGREISMRLMSLATFPRLEVSEREVTIAGKLKCQPQSIGFGKGSPKGKMAFKLSQQFKQQHQKQEQQKQHQHKRQQKQAHPSSRMHMPSTSSPRCTEPPLSHSTPQQNQIPMGAPVNNMKAQTHQGWSHSPRSSMPATPPSVLGAPEDAHMPLAFMPPSVGMSPATPSTLQDNIMPLTKTHFLPQHQLLQNGPTLFYGTPQQDIQSTTTQGTIATAFAPEHYANSVPTGMTSLNMPNNGYLRLGQGTVLHHHPYANVQPPPSVHVISQQQLQHQLQPQQLGLTSLLVYLNAAAFQPG